MNLFMNCFTRSYSKILLQKNRAKKSSSPECVLFTVFPSHAARDMSYRLPLATCSHQTLISTSTPLGSSNFIKASIVFDEEL